MKQEQGQNRSKQWIVITLLVAVIIILLILLLRGCGAETAPVYEKEVAAKLGQLEGKSEAEIQAELNRVVQEGMFHIVINSDPVFYDGTSEGNLEIENVPNNLYLMRVEIVENASGEILYSTKYIDPNSHIQRAALLVDLEAGEYPATAVFYAYDKETLAEVGSTGCQICIHVQN